NDTILVRACADNREDFVRAMLEIGAGASLGIAIPSLLRFLNQAHRHTAMETASGFEFTHEDGARDVSADEATWMIELIARSVVRLEEDWPGLILVRDSKAGPDRSR